MDSPANFTLAQARNALRARELSPRELVESILSTIEARNDSLGGYLTVDSQAALAAADKADVSLPLGGLPIAIKDLINVQGQPCSCASRFLQGHYTAPYDAGAIVRLKQAGAIPLGRTNMDEFAMGSSTENSAIQISRNPRDTSRVPGGSSGGSAVVVAANMALAALGSDTGGSIRQPAAFCGITGLKPTYGRVSRYGMVAFASSLDQIGPMTKTVEDAALLLQAIAGHDPMDSTSLKDPVPDYSAALEKGVKGLRIGVPREYFGEGLQAAVRDKVTHALHQLEKAGATLVEISLPATDHAIATYYILATAEASANLARFDGIRYGKRSDAAELIDLYEQSREDGFGPEVKRRILLGTYVLSSGYYDAYYRKAQKARTLIRREFEEAFARVDLIAGPATPEPAWKIGDRTNDPLKTYLADIYTVSANLAGIPGLSVPCGTIKEGDSDLPVGLQLLGPHLGESVLLQAAAEWERL
jgi:aspartyl-tRNA(Asn)/glutamyl-tRNA(Gln) amidotransferase subunit A